MSVINNQDQAQEFNRPHPLGLVDFILDLSNFLFVDAFVKEIGYALKRLIMVLRDKELLLSKLIV